MTRICAGTNLPRADRNKFYLLRTFGTKGHETWDVTDPENPKLLATIGGNYRDTHKSWWECETGIAYLVSARAGLARQAHDRDLRSERSGEAGEDPRLRPAGPGAGLDRRGADRPAWADLHAVEVNRVYFGYGTSTGGILQIVDREKLLKGPKEPTPENLRYPEISKLVMYPMVGAHTTFPMLEMEIEEFAMTATPSATSS